MDDDYVELEEDAELDVETRTTSTREPYGPSSKAKYADSGAQSDKKKRYPLDTVAHCKAAWSYINMPKNAAKYTSEQLAAIKSKIKAAAKRLGITIAEDKKSNRSEDSSMIETRSANVNDVDFGQRIITVMAVPYEQPTQVMYRKEVWNEVFTRTAYAGLEGRQKRIPVTSCLQVPDMDHGQGHIVGRVQDAFPDREDGLVTDLKISRTERGDETLELARDEALGVSVGFMIKDPYRDEMLDHRSKTRRINRAFLDHLAFVGQPAYPGAKVLAMRSDGIPEVDYPADERPFLNDFANDPLFQWASERISSGG